MNRWVRVLALAACVPLLAGCVKADLDLSIGADDRVSGTFVFGILTEYQDLIGQDVDLGSFNNELAKTFKVKVDKYQDDKYTGEIIRLKDIRLKKFAESMAALNLINISRNGDYLMLQGMIDPNIFGDISGGQDFNVLAAVAAAPMELGVSITLPGEITSTNGIVTGNTITWPISLGGTTEIRAEAYAPPGTTAYLGSSAADLDTPSALSKLPALNRFNSISELAKEAGKAVGGAMVLSLLLAWPSNLIGTAVVQNREHWSQSLRRRFRRNPKTSADPAAATSARGLRALKSFGVLAAASLFATASDPNFGFSAQSLRVFLTALAAFIAVNILAVWISYRMVRRVTDAERPKFVVRPQFLWLIGLAALLARVTEIQPALVFGAVTAIEFTAASTGRRKAAATVISEFVALIVGFTAWAAYSILQSTDVLMWRELSSLICIEILVMLPILLLPIASLDGARLWQWHKLAWVIAYAFALGAFALVLVPLPASWDEVQQSLSTWIAIYVAYCLMALCIWLVGRATKPKPAQASVDAALPDSQPATD